LSFYHYHHLYIISCSLTNIVGSYQFSDPDTCEAELTTVFHFFFDINTSFFLSCKLVTFNTSHPLIFPFNNPYLTSIGTLHHIGSMLTIGYPVPPSNCQSRHHHIPSSHRTSRNPTELTVSTCATHQIHTMPKPLRIHAKLLHVHTKLLHVHTKPLHVHAKPLHIHAELLHAHRGAITHPHHFVASPIHLPTCEPVAHAPL
jgi:hypothetical protein